jgi:hypothetical protein
VLEDLLGEERTAFRLGIDHVDKPGGRFLVGQRPQHLGHAFLRQAPEREAPGQSPTGQFLEGAGQGTAGVDLAVAVQPHHEDGYFGDSLGQVRDQEHGGLVGPVDVVENEEGWLGPGGPGRHFPDAVE